VTSNVDEQWDQRGKRPQRQQAEDPPVRAE
jgi:hypothetical protein